MVVVDADALMFACCGVSFGAAFDCKRNPFAPLKGNRNNARATLTTAIQLNLIFSNKLWICFMKYVGRNMNNERRRDRKTSSVRAQCLLVTVYIHFILVKLVFDGCTSGEMDTA